MHAFDVSHALHVLVCALCLPYAGGGAGVGSKWVKAVKKALDDSGSQSQHMWLLLLKQAHCLQGHRALFVNGVFQTAVR